MGCFRSLFRTILYPFGYTHKKTRTRRKTFGVSSHTEADGSRYSVDNKHSDFSLSSEASIRDVHHKDKVRGYQKTDKTRRKNRKRSVESKVQRRKKIYDISESNTSAEEGEETRRFKNVRGESVIRAVLIKSFVFLF